MFRTMPESEPIHRFLFVSLSDLEAKYRACRDARGRFASCGGGTARMQDVAHIRGRSGTPTAGGPGMSGFGVSAAEVRFPDQTEDNVLTGASRVFGRSV